MLAIPTDSWFWWILSIIITISDFMWNWVIWIAWRHWLGTYELPSKAIPLLCYSLEHCFMMVIGCTWNTWQIGKKTCGVSWFSALLCSQGDNPQIHFKQARFMQAWHEMHELMLCLYVQRGSLTAAVSLYGRNASSAFQWYLEAAKRGSATGQFLVGLAYSNGVAWRVGNFKFQLGFCLDTW